MDVPGWGSWSAAPLTWLALVAGAAAYAALYRRARRSPAGDRVGVGHWLPFAAGLTLLTLALCSPLDELGDEYLLSAHMLQHLLLADIAPPLLILGLRAPVLPLGVPRRLLRHTAHGGRFGRVWGRLTRPWTALTIWALVQWGWSVPRAFDFAAAHAAVHALEHATLLVSGLMLWWAVLDPMPRERRQLRGSRLFALGASRLASAVVCVPLTWLGTTMYPRYVEAPRAYGLSAIRDQQIAGAGMCLLEFLVFGIALGAVFIDFLGRDERAEALSDRLRGAAS